MKRAWVEVKVFSSALALESALTRDASALRITENATLDVTTGGLVIMSISYSLNLSVLSFNYYE